MPAEGAKGRKLGMYPFHGYLIFQWSRSTGGDTHVNLFDMQLASFKSDAQCSVINRLAFAITLPMVHWGICR